MDQDGVAEEGRGLKWKEQVVSPEEELQKKLHIRKGGMQQFHKMQNATMHLV